MTKPENADEGFDSSGCSPALGGGHMTITGFDSAAALWKADHAYDVERIAKLLDTKYPRWQVCRTMMNQWQVSITNEQDYADKQHFSEDRLAIAMQKAFEWEFLPIVPHEPQVRNQSNFEVRKNGTKWELFYGRGYCTTFGTKKAAEEAIVRWIGLDEQSLAKWESEYAWTRGKKEGIDFRFSR